VNREQKSAVIDEIAEQIKTSEAVFAVDYRGISVAQVADLRTRLRGADARFRVVKNSLSERAADQAGKETLKPMLAGPTALTMVRGDVAMAAKALNDAARQFNLLEFKGGVLNGSVLSADDVRSIARLPSREVLYAQLVGTVAAPLTGLVRGLNALIAGVAIQLQAIADQGLIGSGAPAAAPDEAPVAEAPVAEAPVAEAPAADAAPEEGAAADAAPEEAPAAEAEPEAAPAAEAEPEAAPVAEQTTDDTQAASDAAPSDDKEEA
jgi:large subunit ribosomal protein L10